MKKLIIKKEKAYNSISLTDYLKSYKFREDLLTFIIIVLDIIGLLYIIL